VQPSSAVSTPASRKGVQYASTAASDRLKALIQRHAAGRQFWVQGCAGVVDRIEVGELDSPALRELVDTYCAPLREAGVDTALLGCTHYPLIEPLWRAALGPDVHLLRIEIAVARRAAELWRHPPESAGRVRIETSGNTTQLAGWIQKVLGWEALAVAAWSTSASD